jgi:hypothetical protein
MKQIGTIARGSGRIAAGSITRETTTPDIGLALRGAPVTRAEWPTTALSTSEIPVYDWSCAGKDQSLRKKK